MDVAVIGASGGIGRALTDALVQRSEVGTVYALSRSGQVPEGPKIHAVRVDITDEASVKAAARAVSGELDLIIVATGILSDGADLQPEKSWRNISMNNLERVFRLNTFGPGLVAKHFLPLLARKRRAVFAALSARVGSISDNDLGGWHAYRASKSALNMLIRNFALEFGRKNDAGVVVGLHPGTVATNLSSEFAGAVSHDVFTPAQSAAYLLDVLDGLTAADTGKVFDWKGEAVPP